MAIALFDTLKFCTRLKEAGVPSVQAAAEAEVLSEIFTANLHDLPTKEELQGAKEESRHEIKEVRNELSHEIKEVRTELSHEIKEIRTESSLEIKEVRNELSLEIKEVCNKLSQKIKEVHDELSHKIDEVRHEMTVLRKDIDIKFEKTISTLRCEMSNLRNDMSNNIVGLIKWGIGLIIAQSGFLVGILKFWPASA